MVVKFYLIVVFLLLSSQVVFGQELVECDEGMVSVGVYDDFLLEDMKGHLLLQPPGQSEAYFDIFIDRVLSSFLDRYSKKLCHLKGVADPLVTISFINRPMVVWPSVSFRRTNALMKHRKYLEEMGRLKKKVVSPEFIGVPSEIMPDEEYSCNVKSPWVNLSSYYNNGKEVVHIVINWSVRQQVFDQYLMVHRKDLGGLNELTIFNSKYRSYINYFSGAWRRLNPKDREAYFSRKIPPDLTWLFSTSPNAGADDSTFPDLYQIEEHALVVYPDFISNLIGVCFEGGSGVLKINNILDAVEYIGGDSFKIDRDP
ncbi:hypothetical protein ACJJH9_06815 [Microbulbifer sp. DLAB2-AF]|uniref:hypothetical protein n=1 Tax=Microbulbifer sp. DLAB2-AF TaxID=3243395 RepID=UPI00403A30AA